MENMPTIAGGPAKKKRRVGREPPAADNTVKEDVEPLAESIGNAVGQQYGRATDLARDSLNRSENVIRRNPFSAIFASLGLGFLLAVIRGRK